MTFILIGLVLYTLPIVVFNYVLNKHDNILDNMPYTAEDFGRTILDELGIKDVEIEATSAGDHYDPDKKKIRIKNYRLNRKSITALSIITHEIGHAIQDHEDYAPLNRRQKNPKRDHLDLKVGWRYNVYWYRAYNCNRHDPSR